VRSAAKASARGIGGWVAHIAAIVVLGLVFCPAIRPRPALAESRQWEWHLPTGFPIPSVPEDDPDTPENEANPMSWEKVVLGRFLFYDTRMSGCYYEDDQSGCEQYACATCHQQELAFTDGMEHAIGSTGQDHPRGSMSLTNVAYASNFTWGNPLIGELEQQALGPMFGETPVELGLTGKEEQLFASLGDDPRYRRLFEEAFPDDSINLDTITKAIASFERTLISGNSPFDRYLTGVDESGMSPAALRGAALYFDNSSNHKFECSHCHGPNSWLFSFSEKHYQKPPEVGFFNTGLYNIDGEGGYPAPNRGKYEITGKRLDMGAFKAPTLRNIAVTAPYMHDGSVATLDEVLDIYLAGGRVIPEGEPDAGDGRANPYKNSLVFDEQNLVTEQEKQDLIAFLESLTDEEFLANPSFSDPFTVNACPGDCDQDGAVTVNELVADVDVSLGSGSLALCWVGDTDGNGEVDVGELLQGINAALYGCP
jgi:cytochrome c peroxidase